MQANRAEPTFHLPPDLISELARRGTKPRTDMQVEGWKPSLLARILGFFGPKAEEER